MNGYFTVVSTLFWLDVAADLESIWEYWAGLYQEQWTYITIYKPILHKLSHRNVCLWFNMKKLQD